MGKLFNEITPEIKGWIGQQKMFFVATAYNKKIIKEVIIIFSVVYFVNNSDNIIIKFSLKFFITY